MRQLPDPLDTPHDTIQVLILNPPKDFFGENEVQEEQTIDATINATVVWRKFPIVTEVDAEPILKWVAFAPVLQPEGMTYIGRLEALESELRLLAKAYRNLFDNSVVADQEPQVMLSYEAIYNNYDENGNSVTPRFKIEETTQL
jgi:hypothetical protein